MAAELVSTLSTHPYPNHQGELSGTAPANPPPMPPSAEGTAPCSHALLGPAYLDPRLQTQLCCAAQSKLRVRSPKCCSPQGAGPALRFSHLPGWLTCAFTIRTISTVLPSEMQDLLSHVLEPVACRASTVVTCCQLSQLRTTTSGKGEG